MNILKKKEGESHTNVYKMTLWSAVIAFLVSVFFTVVMILFVDFGSDLLGKFAFVSWQVFWFGLLSIILARIYERNDFSVARGVAIAGIMSCLVLLLIGIYQAFFWQGEQFGSYSIIMRIQIAVNTFLVGVFVSEISLTVKNEMPMVVLAKNITAIVTGVAVAVLDIVVFVDTSDWMRSGEMLARLFVASSILCVTGTIVTRVLAMIYKGESQSKVKQSTAGVEAGTETKKNESAGKEMNKETVIKELQNATGRSERDCILMNNILENHFLIGRNNKREIIEDFMKQLEVDEATADDLYNKCCGVIMSGIFRRG